MNRLSNHVKWRMRRLDKAFSWACFRYALFGFVCCIGFLFAWHLFTPKLAYSNKSNDGTERAGFYSLGTPELFRIASLFFPSSSVTHYQGVVYDQYSINELGQTHPGDQWLRFRLPHELNRETHQESSKISTSTKHEFDVHESPPTKTTIAFLNEIYVVTDESFTDRHTHLKKVFHRHHIPIESITWQFNWTRGTCGSTRNQEIVRKTLNLKLGFYPRTNYCPIIMKHIDAWHDIARKNHSLALILEDDSLFVPFFKEKLNRVIYNAIRTGALHVNRNCLDQPLETIPMNEWIKQEPMIVIGVCFGFHDKNFNVSNRNAYPILSTHKNDPTRCAHAYLLTGCSARALLREIQFNYIEVDTPDFLLNALIKSSKILQSFWLDPPLVYQGNRITHDIDEIPTFKETKYQLAF